MFLYCQALFNGTKTVLEIPLIVIIFSQRSSFVAKSETVDVRHKNFTIFDLLPGPCVVVDFFNLESRSMIKFFRSPGLFGHVPLKRDYLD